MKKKLTLIKLGGSIITDKEKSMTVRHAVLKRLVAEIAAAQQETGELYIVGHGQGSYAHEPATKYRTIEGFVTEESQIGMALTQNCAAQLNRIVVQEFLQQSLPAVSFYFSNTMVTAGDKVKDWCGHVLEEYLHKGLLPVTCGDVLVDEVKGCTIWSTEKVLSHIAEKYSFSDEYQIAKVIHVTEVPGVLDSEGQIVPRITQSNIHEIEKLIGGTKGFDVTGGMGHKLEEAMKLAKKNIQVVIVSGMEKGRLYSALVGRSFAGTIIEHEKGIRAKTAVHSSSIATPHSNYL